MPTIESMSVMDYLRHSALGHLADVAEVRHRGKVVMEISQAIICAGPAGLFVPDKPRISVRYADGEQQRVGPLEHLIVRRRDSDPGQPHDGMVWL